MLIRLALCMTSIFFSVSPASILTARMRQFSRVSKVGKTFSLMTFHSIYTREAEMLSVSPDENLAIPRENRRSTHVAQTVWCMIHLLVGSLSMAPCSSTGEAGGHPAPDKIVCQTISHIHRRY